jgi:hypothetical protein
MNCSLNAPQVAAYVDSGGALAKYAVVHPVVHFCGAKIRCAASKFSDFSKRNLSNLKPLPG